MTLRRLVHRLLALVRGRRLDRELDDEVLAHLELAERDALAAGLSPEEARRAARRYFGGIEQMKEEHRERRSVRWIETLLKDVRYGLASLARDPGFSAIAVGVLALGIGANAAMFSIVDAVLLQPLPFPDPERIVMVMEAPTKTSRNSTSSERFLEWKRLSTVFEALAAQSMTSGAATIGGEPTRLSGKRVSADYFTAFGIRPLLGRTFTAQEDQPGAARVAVLSHATWQTRFGSDPDILNHDLVLDGEPHRIIGVLPAGAFDREVVDAEGDVVSFWKPLVFAPGEMGGEHWLSVVGRLRPGVSVAQAQSQMLIVNGSLGAITPQWKKDEGWSIAVDPFDQRIVFDLVRQSIGIAFGAVLLVLLIACANIANLLLAKGVARRKEMAIRAALGASRGRLMAQLLTESLVLSLIGGGAGLALAALLIQTLLPRLPGVLPFTADVTINLRVLAFVTTIAIGVSLLVGVLPSLRTSAGNLSRGLNEAGRGSSGSQQRVRQAIVVGEVAVSLVLICGALLLFKSLVNLQRVDLGVRVDHVITMSTDLPVWTYPTPEAATHAYEAIVQRIETLPGVERAAVSQDLPLQGVKGGEFITVAGREGRLVVRFKRVDAHYFGALGMPIVAGRPIAAGDRAGSPRVVVINQELARHLADRFGMTNPIGQTVRIGTPGFDKEATRESVEIVGVIRNERVNDSRAPLQDVAYVSLAQVPRREIKLLVRTAGDPAAALPSIRDAIRQIDPRLPLDGVRTMDEVKQASLLGASAPTWVIGVFATVAALLAALGLYGVVSSAVTQRHREIGIRMALGASWRDVLSHIVRDALTMVFVGLAAGFVGAMALTRVTASLLFEVSALDPVVFVSAGVVMTLIGLIAALVPASRAARVNPTDALRGEG